MHQGFNSRKANELAGSIMIDWPGRPGTRVPDQSTFQCMEFEYMLEDEYDEVLEDFTGSMLCKYIPRAYPNLALDICMPGGGYIFDCDGNIDLAREENLDAMFQCTRQIWRLQIERGLWIR